MTDDRLFTILLALLVLGLFLLPSRRESPSDARIAQLEAQLAVAQRQVEELRGRSNKATDKVATRKQALQTADTVVRIGVKAAERIISDSTASPDTVRVTLERLVTKITMYQTEVLRYQESVDSLLQAHVAERTAYEVNMQLLQARVPEPCIRFGVPCPNRSTAFLLGVGSALLLAVAVAF